MGRNLSRWDGRPEGSEHLDSRPHQVVIHFYIPLRGGEVFVRFDRYDALVPDAALWQTSGCKLINLGDPYYGPKLDKEYYNAQDQDCT